MDSAASGASDKALAERMRYIEEWTRKNTRALYANAPHNTE